MAQQPEQPANRPSQPTSDTFSLRAVDSADRMARSLSPWVAEMLGGVNAPTPKGSLVHRLMRRRTDESISFRSTLSILKRFHRIATRSLAWKADLGTISPGLFENFSDVMFKNWEIGANNIEALLKINRQEEAIDMPLAGESGPVSAPARPPANPAAGMTMEEIRRRVQEARQFESMSPSAVPNFVKAQSDSARPEVRPVAQHPGSQRPVPAPPRPTDQPLARPLPGQTPPASPSPAAPSPGDQPPSPAPRMMRRRMARQVEYLSMPASAGSDTGSNTEGGEDGEPSPPPQFDTGPPDLAWLFDDPLENSVGWAAPKREPERTRLAIRPTPQTPLGTPQRIADAIRPVQPRRATRQHSRLPSPRRVHQPTAGAGPVRPPGTIQRLVERVSLAESGQLLASRPHLLLGHIQRQSIAPAVAPQPVPPTAAPGEALAAVTFAPQPARLALLRSSAPDEEYPAASTLDDLALAYPRPLRFSVQPAPANQTDEAAVTPAPPSVLPSPRRVNPPARRDVRPLGPARSLAALQHVPLRPAPTVLRLVSASAQPAKAASTPPPTPSATRAPQGSAESELLAEVADLPASPQLRALFEPVSQLWQTRQLAPIPAPPALPFTAGESLAPLPFGGRSVALEGSAGERRATTLPRIPATEAAAPLLTVARAALPPLELTSQRLRLFASRADRPEAHRPLATADDPIGQARRSREREVGRRDSGDSRPVQAGEEDARPRSAAEGELFYRADGEPTTDRSITGRPRRSITGSVRERATGIDPLIRPSATLTERIARRDFAGTRGALLASGPLAVVLPPFRSQPPEGQPDVFGGIGATSRLGLSGPVIPAVSVQPPYPAPPHSREGSGSTPPPQRGRLGGGEQLRGGELPLASGQALGLRESGLDTQGSPGWATPSGLGSFVRPTFAGLAPQPVRLGDSLPAARRIQARAALRPVSRLWRTWGGEPQTGESFSDLTPDTQAARLPEFSIDPPIHDEIAYSQPYRTAATQGLPLPIAQARIDPRPAVRASVDSPPLELLTDRLVADARTRSLPGQVGGRTRLGVGDRRTSARASLRPAPDFRPTFSGRPARASATPRRLSPAQAVAQRSESVGQPGPAAQRPRPGRGFLPVPGEQLDLFEPGILLERLWQRGVPPTPRTGQTAASSDTVAESRSANFPANPPINLPANLPVLQRILQRSHRPGESGQAALRWSAQRRQAVRHSPVSAAWDLPPLPATSGPSFLGTEGISDLPISWPEPLPAPPQPPAQPVGSALPVAATRLPGNRPAAIGSTQSGRESGSLPLPLPVTASDPPVRPAPVNPSRPVFSGLLPSVEFSPDTGPRGLAGSPGLTRRPLPLGKQVLRRDFAHTRRYLLQRNPGSLPSDPFFNRPETVRRTVSPTANSTGLSDEKSDYQSDLRDWATQPAESATPETVRRTVSPTGLSDERSDYQSDLRNWARQPAESATPATVRRTVSPTANPTGLSDERSDYQSDLRDWAGRRRGPELTATLLNLTRQPRYRIGLPARAQGAFSGWPQMQPANAWLPTISTAARAQRQALLPGQVARTALRDSVARVRRSQTEPVSGLWRAGLLGPVDLPDSGVEKVFGVRSLGDEVSALDGLFPALTGQPTGETLPPKRAAQAAFAPLELALARLLEGRRAGNPSLSALPTTGGEGAPDEERRTPPAQRGPDRLSPTGPGQRTVRPAHSRMASRQPGSQAVQRLEAGGWRFKRETNPPAAAESAVHRALTGLAEGRSTPLPVRPRTLLERVLQRDFAGVRVQMASLGPLGIQAGVRDQTVFLDRARADLKSVDSLALLSHELTHVAASGAAPLLPSASGVAGEEPDALPLAALVRPSLSRRLSRQLVQLSLGEEEGLAEDVEAVVRRQARGLRPEGRAASGAPVQRRAPSGRPLPDLSRRAGQPSRVSAHSPFRGIDEGSRSVAALAERQISARQFEPVSQLWPQPDLLPAASAGAAATVDLLEDGGWRFKRSEGSAEAGPAVVQRAAAELTARPRGGMPLPRRPRTLMERVLQRDFSGVRLQAAGLEALGVEAAAQGQTVYLQRSDLTHLERPDNLALLGHELTHVAVGTNPPVRRSERMGLGSGSGPDGGGEAAALPVALPRLNGLGGSIQREEAAAHQVEQGIQALLQQDRAVQREVLDPRPVNVPVKPVARMGSAAKADGYGPARNGNGRTASSLPYLQRRAVAGVSLSAMGVPSAEDGPERSGAALDGVSSAGMPVVQRFLDRQSRGLADLAGPEPVHSPVEVSQSSPPHPFASIQRVEGEEGGSEDEEIQDENQEPDWDRLAEKIYPLIKRMVMLERERRPL